MISPKTVFCAIALTLMLCSSSVTSVSASIRDRDISRNLAILEEEVAIADTLSLLREAMVEETEELLEIEAAHQDHHPDPIIIPSTPSSNSVWSTLTGAPTILFGHRGDPYFMPEHSIGSYNIAIEEGADFVEPDLALTKDGILIASHDLYMDERFDIANHPEFANRKRINYQVDTSVAPRSGWYIQDFTLLELKTLRIRQVVSDPSLRSQVFNNLFQVLTLEEIIEFVQNRAKILGRNIGIVPETKHPTHHAILNVAAGRSERYLEDTLLSTLTKYGYQLTGPTAGEGPYGSVVIQSAEAQNLRYLHSKVGKKLGLVHLMWWIDSLEVQDGWLYDWYFTPAGLDEIATYATIIGPPKECFTVGAANLYDQATMPKYEPYDLRLNYTRRDIGALGGYIKPEELAKEIHKRGLQFTPYTFRNGREDTWIAGAPSGYATNKTSDLTFEDEIEYFMSLGVDGIFVEKLSSGMAARNRFTDQLVGKTPKQDYSTFVAKHIHVPTPPTNLIHGTFINGVLVNSTLAGPKSSLRKTKKGVRLPKNRRVGVRKP